ncbi:hypothetical protein Tco_1116138 [Tanacetum coccineum]
MHANKSFNRNPVNHRLYHALIKALIEDENAMDKGVADTVRDLKRKHDDDEDDDDKDPPAGLNQGKTPTKGSKTSKSTLAKEPVEEPIAEVIMDDVGDDLARDDNSPQDTLEPKTRKTLNPEWFKLKISLKISYKLDWNNPEGDRYLFDLSKPLPLQGPPGHRTVAADYFFNNDLEYLKTSDPKMMKMESSTRVKGVNCGIDLSDFVNLHLKDIEDMLFLAVQHKLFHLDRNVIVDFIMALKIEFKEPCTPSYDPPGIVYEDLNKQKRVLRVDELYKFSNDTLKFVRDEIHHRELNFRLDYNLEMPMRKWTAVDRKKSGLMIELVDKQMREREIIKTLERLVGTRELNMDYKLMTRTV